MVQNIKDFLATKGIDGEIILYRDKQHKKKALCEYLEKNIGTDKDVSTISGGAFGLYLAKAFPKKKAVIIGIPTPEYRAQIDRLSHAVVVSNIRETSPVSTNAKDYSDKKGYYFVDQYKEPLIKEYYKKHFTDIVTELGDIHVDAFCDCGHSCATMAGAIENELTAKWSFILGVVVKSGRREHVHHLTGKENMFVQETTRNFDTKQLQVEIEKAYPKFGNVFEATRSISAAMSWLQKNPKKTVLVYVGDSPVLGEDAIIKEK